MLVRPLSKLLAATGRASCRHDEQARATSKEKHRFARPAHLSSSSSSSSLFGHSLSIDMKIGFIGGFFGFLVLAHAAYATIQYRNVLKIMEEEFSGPPMNVVAELLLGLGFCIWAALNVPGKFHSILPHSEENRLVSLPANLDFMIFNHRGRAFPLNTNLKLKQ